MLIGNMEVAPNTPCKIVAELGTLHHDGGIKSLMLATRDAFNAGADAVKIQCINPDTAFWADFEQKKRYKRLYKNFPPEQWIEYLDKANREFKKPVFASVFDVETFNLLKPVMPAVKLAFLMRRKKEIVRAVVAACIPTVMSFGDDITSKRLLRETLCGATNLLRLYVQSAYPLDDSIARLPVFGTIFHGLSVHSKNYDILAASFILRSQMLEVHCQGTDANGNDTKFALNMAQLEKLVRLRAAYSCLSVSSESVSTENED